ncbi:MAG: hypothetical protein ACI8P3_000083 [Saprospiraceae bacterium]|jgi:hypothetical protein
MNKYILAVLFSFFSGILLAQPIGGENVYEFLTFSPSARITALGGNLISVSDDDVVLAALNPATLNIGMHNQMSFNHNFYVAGISTGYVAYGFHAEKLATTFHGGLQYMSYGTFDAADEFGQITGTFKASEYAFSVGAAHQLYEKLTVGANLKLITSQLEDYNSFGAVADLGAYYQDTSGLFSMGLVLKNVGAQITTYNDDREPVPFDMQLGISRRLEHLPFRVSMTYHHLHQWNILYDDPNAEQSSIFLGEFQPQTENRFSTFADNLFRHMIFSGEFLLGKKENLRIRVAYSHFQRQELNVENFRSLSGFSMGLGIKVNRFRVEFGKAFNHLAGGMSHLSISTNLKEFRR